MNTANPNSPPVIAPPVVRRPPCKPRRRWWLIISVSVLLLGVAGFMFAWWTFPAMFANSPHHQAVYESLAAEYGVGRMAVMEIDGPRTKGGLVLMRAKVATAPSEVADLMWLLQSNRTIAMTPRSHPEFYVLWNDAKYLDGSAAPEWPLPEYVAERKRGSEFVGGMVQSILEDGLGN